MIQNTNLRLKNKVAIVVGGGQRIGELLEMDVQFLSHMLNREQKWLLLIII